jgi:hypothetical protein
MRRACLLLLCLFACKRSGDEAARARIFSPEEPANVSPETKEHLDARVLESDEKAAERILHMKQKEIAQRLGSHKAEQRVQFAWFRGPGLADGGSEVSIAEETTLQQSGEDFTVRLVNDHNQGFELVWTEGRVFVKGLYGAFHERRTDRSDPEGVRERALGGLAAFDRLARGLKLHYAGDVTSEGRRVARYTVTGFGALRSKDEKTGLPKIVYPEGHPDPDTARRLQLWEKEQPDTVSGTVLIDVTTGAPFACDLTGHFRVPGESGPAAELDLHTVLSTTGVGKAVAIATPKAEPEPSAPHAVKDPLRFLGKEPGAAAGKASNAEPADEQDDTEEEAEPPQHDAEPPQH